MKKFLCSALLALSLLLGGACAVDLYVDGALLQTDAPPTVQNGRTLVPLRAIFEALDAPVHWDGSTGTASAQKGNISVRVTVHSKVAYVNGAAHPLDVPAQLIDGRTMVPARFVSEALGARVLWDADTKTVYILTDGHPDLVVDFLDVGQADSTLLSCGGEYMLIDGGMDGAKVVAALRERGVHRLKYVAGTHPHDDHIGGLDEVIRAFPVEHVLLPDVTANTASYRNLLSAIEAHSVPTTVPPEGTGYPLGGATVRVLAAQRSEDMNNESLVFKASYQTFDFLFMADAEMEIEQYLLHCGAPVDAEVLRVGHHGSNSSTTAAFLRAVRPQAAVISCGKDNTFGHPSQKVLARLSGTSLWRTDLNGTVTAMTGPSGLRVTAAGGSYVLAGQSHRIYVTKSGQRYHYDPNCSSATYYECTLEEALARGLSPCSRCVK